MYYKLFGSSLEAAIGPSRLSVPAVACHQLQNHENVHVHKIFTTMQQKYCLFNQIF